MPKEYISIILPLYGLDEYLNSDQYMYNFYYKLGVPIHITFIYNMDVNEYNRKKKDIKKVLKDILKLLSDLKYKLVSFNKLPKMVYLDPNHTDVFRLAHNIFLKRFDQDPNKQIYKSFHSDYKPHVTVVTSHKHNLKKTYKLLKPKYDKLLPLKFTIKKFWVLHIDKNKNDTQLVDVISL